MAVGMSSFFGGGSLGKAGIFTPSSSGGGGTSPAVTSPTGAPLSVESAAEDAAAATGVTMPVTDLSKPSTGLSDIGTGAALGATIGSVVPVVGTGLGALVGGLFGALGGLDLLGMGGPSDGEIMRDRRKATQRSYAAGQGAYDYVAQAKLDADTAYDTGLASGRAKLAGQGIEVDGSSQWAELQGSLTRTKNDTYASIDAEMAEFRESGGLEWFENDYDYLTGVKTKHGGSARNDAEWMTQEIGQDDHGRSNAMVYDKQQYSQLRTNDNKDLSGTFEEYAQRLAPGVEAYEKASFGTDADKLQYKADTDARIAEANKWYDREVQAYGVRKYNAGKVSTPNDGPTGSDYFKEKDGTIVKKTDSAEYKKQQAKRDFQNQRGK